MEGMVALPPALAEVAERVSPGWCHPFMYAFSIFTYRVALLFVCA
jgi:hypothetical protein